MSITTVREMYMTEDGQILYIDFSLMSNLFTSGEPESYGTSTVSAVVLKLFRYWMYIPWSVGIEIVVCKPKMQFNK